tara:strand:+ start:368 stop:655 length:288 start_codon:yes stop_codon:yes gene_type:complete
MIDTDKYEGHTVGDMTFSQAGEKLWFLEHPHSHNASDCMTINKATLDLIQDAPLLLAEVKRLRHELLLILSDFQTKKTDMYEMRNRIETILKGDD